MNRGNTDFEAFVSRERAAAAESSELNWEKERDEWLGYLNELYETIESFLAEYIGKGITIAYREIGLNEENIGAYKAREMILKVGRQEITMTPVGTLLIGMKGRVDVAGSAGRTRLVLVDSESSGLKIKVTIHTGLKSAPPAPEPAPREIKWAWKIATRPPAVRYMELTRDELFKVLLEVANG